MKNETTAKEMWYSESEWTVETEMERLKPLRTQSMKSDSE
jgi:hypothetical protein